MIAWSQRQLRERSVQREEEVEGDLYGCMGGQHQKLKKWDGEHKKIGDNENRL